jgi:protein TonB
MIAGVLLALLIAQANASPAQAQIVPPDWLRKPTEDDMLRVYPRDALRHRVEGHAVFQCDVTERGELADCFVLRETPANQGFGEAALKLTPLFLMRPPTRGGIPVGGAHVTVPISFRFTH